MIGRYNRMHSGTNYTMAIVSITALCIIGIAGMIVLSDNNSPDEPSVTYADGMKTGAISRLPQGYVTIPWAVGMDWTYVDDAYTPELINDGVVVVVNNNYVYRFEIMILKESDFLFEPMKVKLYPSPDSDDPVSPYWFGAWTGDGLFVAYKYPPNINVPAGIETTIDVYFVLNIVEIYTLDYLTYNGVIIGRQYP